MSCHNATENGAGLELWDLTKYDRLWGINDVENVQGDFKIDQERTQGQSGVFSYDWMHAYYDNMRHGAGVNGSTWRCRKACSTNGPSPLTAT